MNGENLHLNLAKEWTHHFHFIITLVLTNAFMKMKCQASMSQRQNRSKIGHSDVSLWLLMRLAGHHFQLEVVYLFELSFIMYQ